MPRARTSVHITRNRDVDVEQVLNVPRSKKADIRLNKNHRARSRGGGHLLHLPLECMLQSGVFRPSRCALDLQGYVDVSRIIW